jgi:hypothetical protein
MIFQNVEWCWWDLAGLYVVRFGQSTFIDGSAVVVRILVTEVKNMFK